MTATVVLVALSLVVFTGELRSPAVAVTAVDDAVVEWLAGVDGPGLSATMKVLAAAGSWVTITALLWGLLLALVILRRLRHLLVVVIAWTLQGLVIQYVLGPLLRRPRPFGVEFRTDWYAWAMPSEQIAALAVTLVGILYAVVPEGRWRQAGKWAATAVVALVAIARMHLGVEAPTDVVVGAVIGVTIPLLGFRLFTPNEAFPVTYRRGRAAHLDIGGARGRGDPPGAGRPTRRGGRGRRTVRPGRVGRVDTAAHQDQRRPEHAGCSASSTPAATFAPTAGTSSAGNCCMAGWRTRSPSTRYGGWCSRRTTRCTSCISPACPPRGPTGSSSSPPSGSTCSSPSSSTRPPSSARPTSTTRVVDDGLALIRKLWDTGLAHRDIKPANLLVRDGHLLLIDVAFVQARPSPWRQAVDLANMMLCLALRSDPELVYQRALRQFSVAEISEAFAAARGLALPSQLRRMLRDQGRDLHGEFLRPAPGSTPTDQDPTLERSAHRPADA